MKFSDVIKTLCVCGCVFGSMCDGVRGMKEHSMFYTLIMYPEHVDWNTMLITEKDEVDSYLKYEGSRLLSMVGNLEIVLSYPPTLKSLRNFCQNVPDKEDSGYAAYDVLSKLLLVFSRTALALKESDFDGHDNYHEGYIDSVAQDLLNLSQDLSLVGVMDIDGSSPLQKLLFMLMELWVEK